MPEPCRSCDEKNRDFGGCRCQAWKLTGDARNADPVCSKSPHHQVIGEAIRSAARPESASQPLVFRNTKNSQLLTDTNRHAQDA